MKVWPRLREQRRSEWREHGLLEAGNFRPADYEGDDTRWLSFAVRQLHLHTGD